MRLAFSIVAAVAALAAALCWLRAATVKVSPAEADRQREAYFAKNGRVGYAKWTLFDGSDMEFTLGAQSKWNRWGAVSASASAAAQAVLILL